MTGRPSLVPTWLAWRTIRWILALPAIPLALWACTSHPLEKPDPLPEQQTDQYYEVNPIRDIDILFMIDNSPSMGDKQNLLAMNTPAFMNVLKNIPGGLPNVHVGVVSSDLGAGPTFINGNQCRPGGDRGIFYGAAKRPNCGLTDPKASYIVSLNQGTQNNFMGDISTVFACLAKLGEDGCGQEHQLQAVRVGLYENVTPENKGFLRPNAYLGIILLTDEDDCSADPMTNIFMGNTPGFTSSWRCAWYGHQCGGKLLPFGEFSAPYDSCTTNDQPRKGEMGLADGGLIPVQQIVDSVRALKQRPDEQIIVAAVTGLPPAGQNAMYKFAKDPVQNNDVDYSKICTGLGVGATGSIRVKKFIDSFGPNGSIHTICTQDFTPALKVIAEKLASKLGTPCINAPLVDQDANPANGVQADCQVIDRLPIQGGYQDTPLPQCSNGPAPCWKLDADMSCAGGYKVTVDRGGKMAAQGLEQAIKCQTCAKADDPRCKR